MSSIKTKISVYLLLVVFMSTSIYALIEFQEIKQNLDSELELSGEQTISRLAKNLVLPLWEMDDEWINEIILTEMMNNNLQAIVVRGADNLLVAQRRDEDWKVTSGYQELTGDFVFRQRKIMHDTESIGQVEVYLSTQFIKTKLQDQLIKTIVSMLMLGFVLFVFVEFMLSKIVVKPLRDLVFATKKLAKGHYDIHLDVKKKDEIGRLANDFNTMLDQLVLRKDERNNAMVALEQSKNELLDLNESLEQHVVERTQDLEKSNAHLQKLSADFEKSKNEAEIANRSKSIFLANMSHELRTPMNAVLGFSRLMKDDINVTPAQKENLEIINRSGNHLLNLINDVLDMAKIESGRMELANQPFDLGVLIRDIIDLMQERAESKTLILELDQSSSFPRYVNSDAAKIRQILVNLLSNAIKCTDKGSVVLRLNTLEVQDKNTITLNLEVEDTGRGIAKEQIPLIFSAFMQAGEQADQNGTGLGLAITNQYVELMGGDVSVRSELGEGALFRVQIPVQKVNEKTAIQIKPVSVQKVIGIAPGQSHKRILVVEDQLENRLLLKRLLESVGFSVYEAVNGQEGIEQFKTWNPDFIWMDRRMPVMDGIEAIKQIRALPGGDVVNIVAVTASVFDQERQTLIQAGASEIVNKPYRDEEIFDCMAKYLGIQYVYDEDAIESTMKSADISAEQISNIPEHLIAELNDAATSLDIEQSVVAIKKINQIDSGLANQLQQLVDQFEFERLLEKITQ